MQAISKGEPYCSETSPTTMEMISTAASQKLSDWHAFVKEIEYNLSSSTLLKHASVLPSKRSERLLNSFLSGCLPASIRRIMEEIDLVEWRQRLGRESFTGKPRKKPFEEPFLTHLKKCDLGQGPLIRQWDELIELEHSRSPGGFLREMIFLNPQKYKEILRKDWLVEPPLTGISFGLALNFAAREIKQEPRDPYPSENARNLEKLFVPIIAQLAEREGIFLCQMTTERFSKEILEAYNRALEFAGIRLIPTDAKHLDISFLPSLSHSWLGSGAALLLLENPEGCLLANHVLYFHFATGVIMDPANGAVMEVTPNLVNIFLSYYLFKVYNGCYKNFSLVFISLGTPLDPLAAGLSEGLARSLEKADAIFNKLQSHLFSKADLKRGSDP